MDHPLGASARHLLKNDVIFWLPSALDDFAALPLLVADLVPCFFAGVFFGEAVLCFSGDAEAADFSAFCCGSASAVPLISSAPLCSRLMPLGSPELGEPLTGNGALSSVPSTRFVVARASLTSCS